MGEKNLFEYKKKYNEIEIPEELTDRIKLGIQRGRIEMTKNKRNNTYNNLLKICAGVVISVGMLTAGINVSPTFAQTLKEIPILGELVRILDFHDGKVQGGQITDGSDVNIIDIYEKDGFENIIIGFSQDGQSQANVGAFKIQYNENPYTMTVEIGGARGISASNSFEEIKKNSLVRDVYKIITLDDSMIRFVIEFETAVDYKAEQMKNPGSLIIGVKESTENRMKESFSVRTNSYPYGERIGQLEEQLYEAKDNNMRVLKDKNDMYFIEIDNFDTLAEAEKSVDVINKSKGVKCIIEKRVEGVRPASYPINENKEPQKNTKEKVEQNQDTAVQNKYEVSITDSKNQFYGYIKVTKEGLEIYNDDDSLIHTFKYKTSTFTKSMGEASFKMEAKDDSKVINISGLFSDFFNDVERYQNI